MAYYALRTPPKPKALTTSQLLRRFAIGNVLLYILAGVIWLSVDYSNSKTSAWAPKPPQKHKEPVELQTAGGGEGKGIVLPTSLSYIAEISQGDTEHSPIRRSDFSQAYTRLDRALGDRNQLQREAVIRAANDNSGRGSKACAITWNEGEPVLQLEAPKNGKISLANALNRCAQAVELLR